MVAKRFQTRTEEEIQQLLQDKNSKSTDKATHNAIKMLRDFCKEQNLDESSKFVTFWNKVVRWHLYTICSIFEVGGKTKHLMTGPTGNSDFCLRVSGKQNSLFPLGPVIKCLFLS